MIVDTSAEAVDSHLSRYQWFPGTLPAHACPVHIDWMRENHALMRALAAERDALLRDNEHAGKSFTAARASLIEQRDRLAAENTRLREALKHVQNMLCGNSLNIVRAALAQEPRHD